ncbi:MAG TPA: hypothetical protein VFX39_01310 [Gemmatimonadaceae bacterium]|nr:hypothetical protein [Gemmatimonadaceae bacterium]
MPLIGSSNRSRQATTMSALAESGAGAKTSGTPLAPQVAKAASTCRRCPSVHPARAPPSCTQ